MWGTITREFADGEYTFKLPYGAWAELDEACGAGPMELYVRLLDRSWKAHHLREIIRVALIGGGTDPAKAVRLVRRYVEDRPIMENHGLAVLIMEQAVKIPKGAKKPLGEAKAAETDSQESTSLPSTQTAQH